MKQIELGPLNIKEALRYLGYGKNSPDENTEEIIRECEKDVLKAARPRYTYKIFDIKEVDNGIELVNTSLILTGDSIKSHLKGCDKAVCIAATISADIDKLIRVRQLSDMTKAVITDSLSSVAIEQLCDKIEEQLRIEYPDYFQTFRFGIGYGDLPIKLQGEFLNILNAGKQIGLNVSSSCMLTPTKSVTSIMGLSKIPVQSGRKGCATCNMREICKFRGEGGHCNG